MTRFVALDKQRSLVAWNTFSASIANEMYAHHNIKSTFARGRRNLRNLLPIQKKKKTYIKI